MRIRKILNNNIAIVTRGVNESIIYSPGIAFNKKVGQSVSEDEVQKNYVLDSKDRLEHLSYLLTHSEQKMIEITNQIVDWYEFDVDAKVDDYLYITLLDHISFMIKRGQKGEFIMSPLLWEVKKFYPYFYDLGIRAVQLISREYAIDFPMDEAVSIALHFINIQDEKTNISEKLQDIGVLRDLLNIIKYHFNTDFDEDGINYLRLVTHLQYFIERLNSNRAYNSNQTMLYEQVKTIYPNAYEVVQKIEKYVIEKYNQEISQDEYTYLMIHINRITERAGN